MIPDFPTFKKIERSDEEEIRGLVESAGLRPYADFCFVNMWIWNTSDDMLVSRLHGNLVIMFRDYASREAFLSFIGNAMLEETARELIGYSERHYKLAQLRLIPQEIAEALSAKGFAADTDEGSHDYVYAVSHLAGMDRWKGGKGKGISAFIAAHPHYDVAHVALADAPTERLMDLFEQWGRNKNLESIFDLNEYRAFERLLQLKGERLHVVLLSVDGALYGFTVYEVIGDGEYAISRFAKADTRCDEHVYDILNWEEAKVLQTAGIRYYNWEQDLGIAGLRHSKMRYEPEFLLKKFVVRAQQDHHQTK